MWPRPVYNTLRKYLGFSHELQRRCHRERSNDVSTSLLFGCLSNTCSWLCWLSRQLQVLDANKYITIDTSCSIQIRRIDTLFPQSSNHRPDDRLKTGHAKNMFINISHTSAFQLLADKPWSLVSSRPRPPVLAFNFYCAWDSSISLHVDFN